jgi:hypothetical protein
LGGDATFNKQLENFQCLPYKNDMVEWCEISNQQREDVLDTWPASEQLMGRYPGFRPEGIPQKNNLLASNLVLVLVVDDFSVVVRFQKTYCHFVFQFSHLKMNFPSKCLFLVRGFLRLPCKTLPGTELPVRRPADAPGIHLTFFHCCSTRSTGWHDLQIAAVMSVWYSLRA